MQWYRHVPIWWLYLSKTSDTVQETGIPRVYLTDTWHGHDTNWANKWLNGVGQCLISTS